MLTIVIPETESYDPRIEEFVLFKSVTLRLEHSLIAISKWESKWKKAFIGNNLKGSWEETVSYIRCMTVTQNINPDAYINLSQENINMIASYIEDSMTATTIQQLSKHNSREIITSELIYTWMVLLRIPFETQKWHLERLLTLISVCNLKTNPPKNMSMAETLSRNDELNEARKKEMKTKG